MKSKLVLASASKSRCQLLENAGFSFDIVPAEVDEQAIRDTLLQSDGVEPGDVAEVLARAKAEAVSAALPDRLVIGADQILGLDGKIFEKPRNMDDARQTLLDLRGKTHALHSSVCVAQAGRVVWHHGDAAYLTLWNLTPEFIGRYLSQAGEAVCQSVGAYQLEGVGVQLFERIEGDYFTILGLPLVPLVAYLREEHRLSV